MSQYNIRLMTMADAAQGAKLWSLVFGDEESVVLEFFRIFGHYRGFAACAELDGSIVAAAYCPPGMDYLSPDGSIKTGCYLYAVATHPDHRKHGLAKEICLLLRDTAWAMGMDYLFTKPSEESLYSWYEEKIGAVPCLGGVQKEYTLTAPCTMSVTPLTAEAYTELRSKHLQGLPHVRQDEGWMQWEHLLHTAYGGGFYAVDDHIADCYFDRETLTVNELLPHPAEAEAERLCSGLMHALGASACKCTLLGDGHYVSVASKDGILPQNGWFGNCYG